MGSQNLTFVFVGGMFRSGTTLVARMLNTHPEVSLASDPYLPFFKTLRSHLANELGVEIDPKDPLCDYYFQADQIEVFSAIQAGKLDESMSSVDFEALRGQIHSYAEPFSPRILPSLSKIKGESFQQAFSSMLEILLKHYGKAGTKLIGIKEVWANEFIPRLVRSLPESKFIQVIRDPRAVAASKNSQVDQYPWIFLGRQWRKLAALAWHYQKSQALSSSVMSIRYEDLISKPEETIRRICTFLEIEPVSELFDPKYYVDDYGKPWVQNSSFGNGESFFSTDVVDRWRKVLSNEEVLIIETLCAPEMLLFGYDMENSFGINDGLTTRAPRVSSQNLASWIRKFVRNDALSTAVEMEKEKLRYHLLSETQEEIESLESDVIEGCFLFSEVFEDIRTRLLDFKPASDL